MNQAQISPQISLCVPILNEKENLPQFFQDTVSYFGKFLIPFQIVFALDPSKDESEDLIRQQMRLQSNIKLLISPIPRGRAECLRLALLAAEAPYLAAISADLSTPLGDITKLLQSISGTDFKIAFGTRTDKKDSSFFVSPNRKTRLEITHTHILHEKKLTPFKDPFSTSFVLKKEVRDLLFESLKGKGWYLTPELQKNVLKKDIPYVEVPVHARSRQKMSFPYYKEYLRLLFDSLHGH